MNGLSQQAIDEKRFQLFAFVLATATILYHRSNWFLPEFGLFPLVAAFGVVTKPSSTIRFLILLILQSEWMYQDMPYINNDRMIAFALGCTAIVAWLAIWLRSPRQLPDAGA